MKFRIAFNGRKLGSLGHYRERVERIVEAHSPEGAALRAYDTHEHIQGGAPGVVVSPVAEDAEVTP